MATGLIPWLVQQARYKASVDSLRNLAELEDLKARNAMLPNAQTQQDVDWVRMGPARMAGEREAAYLGLSEGDPIAAQQALSQYQQNQALRAAQQGLAGNPYAQGALGLGKAPAAPYSMNTAGIVNQYTGDYAESTPQLALGQERMAGAGYDLARTQDLMNKPIVARVNGQDVYVRQVAPGVYEPVTDAVGAPMEAGKARVPQSGMTKPQHPLNVCNRGAAQKGLVQGTDRYAAFMASCQQQQQQMLDAYDAPPQGLPVAQAPQAGPPPMQAGGGAAAGNEEAMRAAAAKAGVTLEQLKAWMEEANAAGLSDDLVRQVLREQGIELP